jgi:DNA-directed RNA polymerase specialized sigma24 family protein
MEPVSQPSSSPSLPVASQLVPPADVPPPADLAAPAESLTHEQKVTSPEVRLAIDRRLRRDRRLRPEDSEDLAQLALLQLFAMKDRPENADGYPRMAWRMTDYAHRMFKRSFSQRGKYNAGPTDLADDHPEDDAREPRADRVLELRRWRELWDRLMAEGVVTPLDDRIVDLRLEGYELEEIAQQLGQKPQSVRNRFTRLLEKLSPALARHEAIVIGGAVVTLVTIAVLFFWRHKIEEAHLHDHDIGPDGHYHETSAPAVQADHLRHDALHQCDLRNWDACEKDLDAAQALDPTSDARVEVQRARDRLADERALLLPPEKVPAKPGR